MEQLRKYINRTIPTTKFAIIIYSGLVFICALILNWFLQYAYWQLNSERTMLWINNNTGLFWGSVFIIAVFIVFIFSLFRNPMLSLVIPSTVFVLLGYTNYLKIHYRGFASPLHFDDLRLVTHAAGLTMMITQRQFIIFVVLAVFFVLLLIGSILFGPKFKISLHTRILLGLPCFLILYTAYYYATPFSIIRIDILFILLFTLFSCLLLIWLKRKSIFWKRKLVATICVCAGLAVLSFTFSQNPVRQFVAARSPFPDSHFAGGDFHRNGFLFAFINSMSPRAWMGRPENFSQDKLEEIIAMYTRRAAAINQNRTGLSDTLPNIIVVMSEAFSDPLVFSEFTYSRDPIPHTRNFLRYYPSGRAVVNVFGGGTLIPEFKALTGFFTGWLNRSDVYNMISSKNEFPSIVSHLRSLGYHATAIHPFDPSFYRRTTAFDILGFDNFISRYEMQYPYFIQNDQFIADSAAFREVMNVVRGNTGQFVFLVTMQNHGPYPASRYPDNDIFVTGDFDRHILEGLATHAFGLEQSDIAFTNMWMELHHTGDPFIVLFFGDHLPMSYPPDFFFESGYFLEQFTTPMFLVGGNLGFNLGMYGTYNLGYISPIFFNNIMLYALNMPISPFHVLLNDFYQHVRAMHGGWFISGDHVLRAQADYWCEEVLTLVERLQIIQYDITTGRRTSLEKGFFDVPGLGR